MKGKLFKFKGKWYIDKDCPEGTHWVDVCHVLCDVPDGVPCDTIREAAIEQGLVLLCSENNERYFEEVDSLYADLVKAKEKENEEVN